MSWSSGIWKAHISVMLFGLSAPLSLYVGLPPTELSMGRSIVAGIVLLLVIRPSWSQLGKGLKDSWIMGILLAFHWYGFFTAAIDGSVAWALLSFATYPFWTILIKSVQRSRFPSRKELISILLILAGTSLMVRSEFDQTGSDTIFIGLASALAIAVVTFMNKKAMQEHSPQEISAYQILVAGLVLIPFSDMNAFKLQADQLIYFLIMALVVTAYAYSLFLKSMKEIGETRASYVAVLEPIYGLILTAIMLHELPEPIQYLAAVLILIPSLWKGE